MIALIGAVSSSRSNKTGQVFLTFEVSPQYRLKAAAISVMVELPVVIQVAAEETHELPTPAIDL